MTWGECHLLDFRKVVLWIPIEGEFSKGPQWNVVLRPDLRQIENIPTETLRLFGAEDLEITCPAWIIAVLNGVEEILSMPVWVFRSHVNRFSIVKSFAAEIGLAMNLYVVEIAVRLS